ncbi:hypothetical protein A1O7_02901 [Cladophialophora yegresii CBS 114405]|uniref:FAD-binding domain-containing protein n=1 Tax=Cladophialophora yegresii CBS 114405 TaxID=1182544 RepID=W9WW02_9EURO|nr:uncharacterized protein A1O7_02901 [Cladophialophora yegresii CBS 114405]EXJ62464.1 hypothetical protein A1O7_02901 [Cladophialophora yegresii CBS 114405]
MAPLKILIVGCSIGGPTLAMFLLLSDLPACEKPHITILERSSSIRKQGQNVDIRGAGVTIIRKLGLENVIRASTTGEIGVQIVDAANRVWSSNTADKSGHVSTPTADIEILRGTLADICYRRSQSISEEVQRAGGAGIAYMFGDHLDALEQDGNQVHVRFAKSGKRQSFDVVVGADGLQSGTRSLAWGAEGEKDRIKRLGMYAAFFSIPRGPTDTEWRRWYHAPGRRGIMVRPSDQKDRTTIFMSVVNEEDERLVQVASKGREDVGAQKKLMAEYFQDAGWESSRIIGGMMGTADFYYDMIAQVKMNKWSKGRVVLLGDAGYCASPISGMGTTLAFTGAYTLASALLRNPEDPPAAFVEYEAKMRPMVGRAQKLFPGAPHSMNPQTAWGIWILHAIFYAVKRSGLAHVLFFIAWIVSRLGLATLLYRIGGPPANTVQVEEYGFRQLPEWSRVER